MISSAAVVHGNLSEKKCESQKNFAMVPLEQQVTRKSFEIPRMKQ
jgi:hypothetical protein